MHDPLEQIRDMEKTLKSIVTPLNRLDEQTFRDNILPILLNSKNKNMLNYIVGFTGSPFLGLIVTRNGKDAYEVPAIFDKRFDKSNVDSISGDGVTEKTRSIEKEGRRSTRRQIALEQTYLGSIKGLFKEGVSLDTRAKWKIVLEENGINFFEFFGLKNETKAPTKNEKIVTQDWGDEEL